jgi:hypothetical protein
MYFIDRLKLEFSRDTEGRAPNEHFLAAQSPADWFFRLRAVAQRSSGLN